MNLTITKKIIAAILTVAMAMSPVFIAPASASDGQDVETSASSWRYQDGDIVVDEGLNPFAADPVDYDISADAGEYDREEDFSSQMGSGIAEEEQEQPAQPTEEPASEPAVNPAAEPAEEPVSIPEDQVSDEPSSVTAAPEETDPADNPKLTEEPNLTGALDPAETQDPATEPESAETPNLQEQSAAESAAQTPDAAEPETDPQDGVLTAQQSAPAEEQVQAPDAAKEPAVKLMSATTKNRYWTWSKGKYKRGPGYLKGIDVSYWQGKINWKKVKAAGVDFAIIRCGYGSNKSSQDDSRFAENVKGCIANGIPYGVYIYAHANTVAKANDEADHAIRVLKKNKCKLSYPIYYDLEDRDVARASNAKIREIAGVFCSRLTKAGYPAGVYANLNWWNNKLAGFNGYDKWVAQWAKKCDYKKNYSIWQCTSETSVSGISGRVDANLLMCPKSTIDKYMKKPVITYKFKTIDGKVYLVSSAGKVIKNRFYKFGAYWYAFDKNGVRQAGKRFRIGYKSYILDSKGRAYMFKAKTKKKTSYYAKAGKGKKGKLKKGKSFYVLRTSGKWSQMANGYWIKTSKIKKTAIYPTITPSKKVKYKAKLKKKTRSYSGPSKKYIKKKKFKKKKTVTVIGTYGSWSKLSTGQWLPSSRLKRK